MGRLPTALIPSGPELLGIGFELRHAYLRGFLDGAFDVIGQAHRSDTATLDVVEGGLKGGQGPVLSEISAVRSTRAPHQVTDQTPTPGHGIGQVARRDSARSRWDVSFRLTMPRLEKTSSSHRCVIPPLVDVTLI